MLHFVREAGRACCRRPFVGAARWDRLPEVSDLLAGRPAPSFGKQTNHTIRALLTAFAIFAVTTTLHAQNANQIQPGTRAISMGGAFVAVASDATAVNWNPAAIAALQRQEINLAYADRYGLGIDNPYLAYVLPMRDNHAIGVDWLSTGFGDAELDFTRNKLNFAYGYRNGIPALRRYLGNTAIGVAGKYVSLSTDLDGQQIVNASGWGFDLGVLAPLPYGIRLGALIQDLGNTSVEHEGGRTEAIYPQHYRVGLAVKPIEGLTVAADLDDSYHFGAEYWFRGFLALRAGLQSERDTRESFGDATTASFGLGVKYRFAQVDYAYERHPVLPATHYTSLVLAYNPRVVQIKDAIVRHTPIFRSLYRHYQEQEFFDVVISNSSTEPIPATVSLMLPKMMGVPHQEEVLLPPQSTEQYSLKVTFDSDLFNRDEAYFDNFVTPVVQVSYSLNRQDQVVEKQLERVYVAGKGKLSWNVEGMAAAFVTPEDLAVSGMARGLAQRYNALLTEKFNRSNIGKAAVLFDAMGVYRIRYQADQKTPFTSISDDRTIFDTVQYPSELLEKPEGVDTKIGDCDDLTVLYASLLENLSIDTAFLEANDPGKGHIYLMFDSGVPPDRAEDHFVSSAEYVEWGSRIWIPVETTLFGDTFAVAWRNGATEYKRLKVRNLIDEVDVQQWMQTYKPAVLPPATVELPAAAALDSLLAKDIEFFDQRVDQIALGTAATVDSPEGAYDAGVAYLRVNHLGKAGAMFDRVLVMNAEHTDAINARGVIATRKGDYEAALEFYRRALRLEDNNGIRMNIALTYYLMGERETADRLFEEVVALDDGYLELFDFLSTVGDAQEFYDIGVSYLRQLRLDQAVAQFDLALEADPNYLDAINAKGVVLTRKADYESALALYQLASELAPEQTGFRLNIALVHYLRGEHDKADALYQQIIAQDPAYDGLMDFLTGVESAEESYQAAASYLRLGELKRALERVEQALDVAPDMGHGHNMRAVILARQARYAEAYQALETAENYLPTDPGLRLNMAIVRLLQGRRNEATVIYQQVIEMDSRYKGMLDILEKQ